MLLDCGLQVPKAEENESGVRVDSGGSGEALQQAEYMYSNARKGAPRGWWAPPNQKALEADRIRDLEKIFPPDLFLDVVDHVFGPHPGVSIAAVSSSIFAVLWIGGWWRC